MDCSYDQLVEYVFIGHDIEFEYKDKMYSITNTPNGYSFTAFYSDNPLTFKNPNELLDKVTIENKSLKDIWQDVEVHEIF
ncbi:hypothetical protein JOD24_003061 [Kroppenstedtia sanguinis]|uniref:hypothetical protein n=1 Tax=Kroppenstedtia sanguinis TaxID=1380684 RepID=UPI003D24B775